jgi:hypothetical protein
MIGRRNTGQVIEGVTVPPNPGNARWCPHHKKLECTKNRTKRGGPCHAVAIAGTAACSKHAGIREEVARVRGESMITAWNVAGRPEGGAHIHPSVAVLNMLQMSYLRAAAYGELLRQQVMTETGVDLSTEGLIGYRYASAGQDGHIYKQSEEVRALVVLEAAERDRVVRYAKVAHDMGISERLTDLAESWGDVVATRVTVIISALNLTPEQEALVPALVQAHLGSIDLSAISGR